MELSNEEMYERLGTVLEPVHDELVEQLRPAAGERWLDLGSGTGSTAFRAARAGAEVSAFDGSVPLVEQAREDAEREGLTIRFDTGNVEYLPYEDGEFDTVSSAFGFVYAADHANVAGELARITRSGGRLGFTAWKPNPKLGELFRRFTEEPLEGREATEWGREDHVEDMLGEDFELEFADGALWMEAESGEGLWELFSSSSPPLVTLMAKLDPERGEAFHQGFVELYESYREGDSIRAPRRYLLTLGRRR
ncbi:MAG TPA: class I SAM-dependent methyltransferase [Gaiellaceae bacterium]|jgi:SAM-dependent methyltransferase|nr:class I SAM-dependent methyltransferase [Gaiellaceae bacterium]